MKRLISGSTEHPLTRNYSHFLRRRSPHQANVSDISHQSTEFPRRRIQLQSPPSGKFISESPGLALYLSSYCTPPFCPPAYSRARPQAIREPSFFEPSPFLPFKTGPFAYGFPNFPHKAQTLQAQGDLQNPSRHQSSGLAPLAHQARIIRPQDRQQGSIQTHLPPLDSAPPRSKSKIRSTKTEIPPPKHKIRLGLPARPDSTNARSHKYRYPPRKPYFRKIPPPKSANSVIFIWFIK